VLVSSTVISAVVGLALQDVLKNVFAGMALELEHPFARGDWIVVAGERYQVVDTGWRSTRLRTPEGVEVFEPNSNLATTRLSSYGSGSRPVAFTIGVGLPYDAPPARVKEALLRAARAAPGVAESPPPEAFLERFGDSAIEYRLRVWTRSVGQLARFHDAVGSRIWYELRRAELSIPFPIRTVHLRHGDRDDRRSRGEAVERARELLAHTDLFRSLPAEALDRLALAARHHLFDAGEVLVREGQPGESLFLIDEGRVMVSKGGMAAGTGMVHLASLGPGELFGEMSLLTGEPRSATVTADGPCSVLELDKGALAPLVLC
jgi:hypothetical protein